MFSKSCEYAIRALIYICSRDQKNVVYKIQEIADAIDAPVHYTSKILQQLSRLDIISSMKGPNGGFFIAEKQLDLKLIEVVEAIDGDKIFRGCALGLHMCSEREPCPLHDEFKKIRDDLREMLEKVSISMLSSKLIQGRVLSRK